MLERGVLLIGKMPRNLANANGLGSFQGRMTRLSPGAAEGEAYSESPSLTSSWRPWPPLLGQVGVCVTFPRPPCPSALCVRCPPALLSVTNFLSSISLQPTPLRHFPNSQKQNKIPNNPKHKTLGQLPERSLLLTGVRVAECSPVTREGPLVPTLRTSARCCSGEALR